MPLESAQRTGLVEQVIAQLREQIARGEWAVGDRIPTEPELAAQLGVGRNTVREAVRALAHAGLLEIRQGSGTFVRATSELEGALRRRVARARMREALEVRRALELEAARLAARRRTDDDLRRLDDAMRRRTEALSAGAIPAFVDADVAVHRGVVAAAHNGLLSELYDHFGSALRDSILSSIGERLDESDRLDHQGLVDAVRARDPEAAARITACFLDELLTRTLTAEDAEG
ncbi:FadR/GntR family transcriptional regulator [Allonocardiopsis opalescens]|uniref:DNA-binding FadR family transcriptional regulator n=1 Tax=Allonocardiopsis opalescens TaxID=1144618 RepID=A0A2T0Q4L5_9ACTN|nr:FCD domain-containing protein [Allonocardiopsis opalescens]PRX98713.1 DNA-binding FadR family transcriptional regulator [Allonocardiopsis opalescens]